jgi:N-acetylglucosaminyldiphosphoundecaprenol N-acetyl-beta-D-mannosaminyltransferase
MSSGLKTAFVLGLPIHLATDYVSWIMQRLDQQQGTHIVTLNAEMAMLGEQNADFASIIKKADLVIPDGSGVVLYLFLRGKRQKRTPGIELAQSLLRELGNLPQPPLVCFYGGKPGIAEAAAQYWRSQLPNLKIIANHGFLSPTEVEEWHKLIKQEQPKLIFVALGVPRQEFWIIDNKNLSPGAIFMGVGGSFDIWSGIKSRAPVLWQKLHLEWLYRLYQEPWRWRRMLALPKFFLRSLKF